MSATSIYDVFVIGGGINGCGIARDAAGRGYSVFLAEMGDLASGTSFASTKLIHGGLRYLEHYEFRLVREALIEREALWRIAPHIVRPMRFVLPFVKGVRPAWLLRLGLFLYDHIGGRRRLPPTRTLDMRRDAAARPLKRGFRKAFEYSDCWVDDARLVVLNARDAADRGAEVRTRTRVVSASREAGLWRVRVEDGATGMREEITARLLVNAAGPWVDNVLGKVVGGEGPVRNVRLVQGSHIVIGRKYDDQRAYFFQNRDGRLVFVIPYENDFTVIGTTDRDYVGDPGDVRITEAEKDYLCSVASEYFADPVMRDDVVWSYSGVRPLYDDGASKAQEATRDYVLKEDGAEGAPLISVFGGKITTHRRLAESMLEKVEGHLGRRGRPWTASAPLPGGDFAVDGFDAEVARLRADYPFLEPGHARRLTRLYGTRARSVLGKAAAAAGLGRRFGSDLYEVEVDYLVAHEWALTVEDVLWRRTKQGLRLAEGEVAALADYMAAATGARTAAE